MTNDTKASILEKVLELLALHDPEQISMRTIAQSVGLQQSVLYHHFDSKEQLLKEAFMMAQMKIRAALEALPPTSSTQELMKQRIRYHIDNGHLIVPMLRYFMAVKLTKPNEPGGYIPPQAYRHIKEVIDQGVAEGIYATPNSDNDAKIIVHALNGFVLEYFPNTNKFKDELIDNIQSFLERALRKEVNNKKTTSTSKQ